LFTGIIRATGIVRWLRPTAEGARLAIDAPGLGDPPGPGASVAVNGVCQTVASAAFPALEFDVVPETIRRTTIGRLNPGDRVNLEPSLRATDRVEGHFVQGHVDGIATIEHVVREGGEWLLRVRLADKALGDYIIPKGSVAVDGVSLTIVEAPPGEDWFSVALIPTTVEWTTLGERRPGDLVNVETDVLVRALVRFLRRREAGRSGNVTLALLREHGFA